MGKPSHYTALSYAVRGRAVAHYIGQFCVVQAVLLAVPLGVSPATGSFATAWRGAVAAAGVLAAGLGLRRVKPPDQLQRNEVLA
jgi:hypothetical protein